MKEENSIIDNNKEECLSWPPLDLTKIESKYFCPLCKNVQVNAHQADDCGCRFCLNCLDDYLAQGNKLCPSCTAKLNSTQKIPDKYFQKRIEKLNVKCIYNGDEKCDWYGTLKDYKDHYQEHYSPKPKKCEYCFAEFLKKQELEKHLNKETGDCKKQPIDCLYRSIGCNKIDSNINIDINSDVIVLAATAASTSNMESMDVDVKKNYLTRETFDIHMNNNVNYHLSLVHANLNKRVADCEKFIYDKSYLGENNQNNRKLESGYGSMASTASAISTAYPPSIDYNKFQIDDSRLPSQPNKDMDVPIKQPSSLPYNMVQHITNLARKEEISTNNEFNSVLTNLENKFEPKIQELTTKAEMLENNEKNLLVDFVKLTKMYENLKQENIKYKESIKEYKTICQDLHKTLALTQISLLTLEERLINLEKLSYDGTLIWKITNVQERIQEAKSGRQTSFYSPPFYTSRIGFKMCARIYLNGDGNGRNTHLSLFFVILRGEYDALLKWPFRQKVTFILIDQSTSESRENVYDAFRPDPNSSSFRRPVSEMNIASGLPVFCPLGKLLSEEHEYIKDNTMFIKIIVDTKDISEI